MLTNLKDRIILMKPSLTEWKGGVYTVTNITVSTEWANVQRVNMANDVSNLKNQQMNFYKVTMRNSAVGSGNETINNKFYIIYKSKRLKINCATDGSGRNKMLRMDCEEELI